MAERETTSRMSAAMLYADGSKLSIGIHEFFVRRIHAHAAGMAIASPRGTPRAIWRRPLFITARKIVLAGRSQRHLNAELARALADGESEHTIDCRLWPGLSAIPAMKRMILASERMSEALLSRNSQMVDGAPSRVASRLLTICLMDAATGRGAAAESHEELTIELPASLPNV